LDRRGIERRCSDDWKENFTAVGPSRIFIVLFEDFDKASVVEDAEVIEKGQATVDFAAGGAEFGEIFAFELAFFLLKRKNLNKKRKKCTRSSSCVKRRLIWLAKNFARPVKNDVTRSSSWPRAWKKDRS
jgi:hypothetical protein